MIQCWDLLEKIFLINFNSKLNMFGPGIRPMGWPGREKLFGETPLETLEQRILDSGIDFVKSLSPEQLAMVMEKTKSKEVATIILSIEREYLFTILMRKYRNGHGEGELVKNIREEWVNDAIDRLIDVQRGSLGERIKGYMADLGHRIRSIIK